MAIERGGKRGEEGVSYRLYVGGEGGEIKTKIDVEVDVSIHVDEETGRRYSYNETTGQTQWLYGDDEENGANN